MREIPLRPKNDSDFPSIKKEDKQCLVYSVLMSASNNDAFLLYHPQYITTNGKINQAGKEAAKQFFGYARHRNFIDAYKATLAEFCRSGQTGAPKEVEIDESRKDKALRSLLDKAMTLVEGKGDLDPDTLKIAAEIFKKIGLLKDDEVTIEPPKRFLPARCSECVYKSFVEGAVEKGDVENECLRCRALKVAQENGFRYDPTRLLTNQTDNEQE